MLSPVFWPEVRRGTERMVHELSSGLNRHGHEVIVVTSHRGGFTRGVEEGVSVLRVPRPPNTRIRRRRIEDHLGHVPLSYAVLRTRRQDIAHAWYPTDALAAGRWRQVTGRPAVHSYMGIPDFTGLRRSRWRLGITLRALATCDVTVALSRYAADAFRYWLGYEAPVIPPPVDVNTFTVGEARTEDPTFVCAAALDEARKRGHLLVSAFARVRKERPRARLLLNRPRDAATAIDLVDASEGIELVDMDDRSRLAELYGSAWASVLPSVDEAFGLVLAEALACGTPGVGSNEAGIPEVLNRPGTGVLFSGGEDALARAMLESLELAGDASTRGACRARALELSTERCTEAYESLYSSLRVAAP